MVSNIHALQIFKKSLTIPGYTYTHINNDQNLSNYMDEFILKEYMVSFFVKTAFI